MLRFLTAGESHGPFLTAILEGIPAGLKLSEDDINPDLSLRQQGYGRGLRMHIEKDRVRILSGVRWGETIGTPITLQIVNRDWVNWQKIMSISPHDKDFTKLLTRPRPGHGDLAGLLKFGRKDIRDILERASARETAARVAVGSICKKMLFKFNVELTGYVKQIGTVKIPHPEKFTFQQIRRNCTTSPVRCPDKKITNLMIQEIDTVKKQKNTVGGSFTVLVTGAPPGIGSYIQWDRRLDGRLAQSLMSIPGIKAVQIGAGINMATLYGSQVHDEIFYSKTKGYFRKTNRAGGIEAGVSNGENIVLHATMKPIPSLLKPLNSVDIKTKKSTVAEIVRSDICAVPAASVVGEAVVAFVLTKEMLTKFGGDSVTESVTNWQNYCRQIKSL